MSRLYKAFVSIKLRSMFFMLWSLISYWILFGGGSVFLKWCNDLHLRWAHLLFHPACRPPQKATGRPPTPKLVKSPGAEDPGNLRPVKMTPDSPQQTGRLAEEQDEEQHILSPPLPRPQPVGQNRPSSEPATATGQCPLHQGAAIKFACQLKLGCFSFQSL